MERFFIQDIVALKADPTVRAIVCATWRDSESVDSDFYPDDWIYHKEVRRTVFDETFDKGKPPDGFVMIGFPSPGWGKTIVSESAITLVDRAVFVGDVVKRDIHGEESGIVTNTKIRCKIQPIYTDLPYEGFESWPHKAEDNELWVPSNELRYEDYLPGDYVAYKGWIGEIIHVRQEVTLCLSNGSVVRVQEPEDLESPLWSNRMNRPPVKRAFMDKTLLQSLADVRTRLERTTDTDAMQRPAEFHVGLKVQTKKSNLRLGQWIIGSYSASIPAKGVVVESRVTEIDVEWVTTNIYDREAMSRPPPDNILSSLELDEVKMCTTQIPESPFGSRIAREKMVGDLCRFEFDPDAEQKYSEGSAMGYYRRIPRTMTHGFNMNMFNVIESRSEVEVEWQNGSKSWQKSNSLVPYPVPDDHDLWPGEAVSVKESQKEADGLLRATKVGIVQSVDARDRVAEVRWFVEPDVQCFISDQTTLVPGSKCGRLSDEVSSASLYELYAYPALARRRGDIVLVRPAQDSSQGPEAGGYATLFSQIASRIRDGMRSDSHDLFQRTEDGYPWVGEVVSLTRDGKITVRLGALRPPRDIEVFIDEVDLLVGIDEEDASSFTDDDVMDDIEDDLESFDTETTEAIEETIEYEGGIRLDDGDEDAWMTDSSEEEDEAEESEDDLDDTNGNATNDGASDVVASNQEPEMEEAGDLDPNPTSVRLGDKPEQLLIQQDSSEGNRGDYQFNEYPSMPAQFMVLDDPPPENHHFFSHAHKWSTPGMLRRIRKEHKLLQSSLPRGIWVRTWADRLDLLRVLIVGPQATPYALAPFVLDFAFGSGYPKTAPEAYFHSWTGGVGRINPNLYEDGTVCLSILGTWPESHNNEAWNPDHSSMLQILVSLLGLVLVERPYYNEAGFEDLAGKDEALVNERVYSEKALVMAKGFVVHALKNQTSSMTEIINWIYKDRKGPRLLDRVVSESRALREHTENKESTDKQKLSKGALMLLEKYLPVLEGMADSDGCEKLIDVDS